MAEIKSFTFFKSYYDCLEDLKKEDRFELLIAMIDYVFYDKKPNFRGIKKTIWTLIEPNLNTSKNRSNKNSGAPIGNQNACKIKENDVFGETTETINEQSKNNHRTTNHLLGIGEGEGIGIGMDKEKDKDKEKEKEKGNRSRSIINATPPFFNFSSVLDYGTQKNIPEDYCQKFYDYYSKKRKEWNSDEEWQMKLDEWYKEDQKKDGETKLIKLDEGVYKI